MASEPTAAPEPSVPQAPAEEVGADDLNAWIEQTLATPLQITVTDPETLGSYLTKYTTYLVRTEGHRYVVRRRYSDFEWLFLTLRDRYVGMLLPAMPEKKVMKNDENFIRSRMRALNIFMEQLSRIAYVRSDPALLAFISVQDAREWDAAKKLTVNSEENPSAGELKWQAALSNVAIPENAERVVLDIKRQLDPLEKCLDALVSSTKRLADKSAIYAAEMAEMKVGFQNWKVHEESCGDPARSEYPNKNFEQLNQVMDNTGTMYGSWQEILSFQPSINELLLHENIKYQYFQVLNFRDMLKRRDQMIADHTKALKSQEKHEAEQQAAAARGKAEKVAKLEKDIQEDKRNVERCMYKKESMTQGLFFSELDKFFTNRNALLREAMGQLSAAHFQYAKRLGMMWQGYIQAIEVDPQDMMEKAKVVFSQAAKADGFEGEGDA